MAVCWKWNYNYLWRWWVKIIGINSRCVCFLWSKLLQGHSLHTSIFQPRVLLWAPWSLPSQYPLGGPTGPRSLWPEPPCRPWNTHHIRLWFEHWKFYKFTWCLFLAPSEFGNENPTLVQRSETQTRSPGANLPPQHPTARLLPVSLLSPLFPWSSSPPSLPSRNSSKRRTLPFRFCVANRYQSQPQTQFFLAKTFLWMNLL